MTLPQHVPPQFKDAVKAFADSLQANFASVIAANPEDQLKGPVQALLSSVARRVETRTEAQLPEVGGRPDIGVAVKKLLCGYVELKAPGKGARVTKYKGADKAQWEKFKAVPNILYTDGWSGHFTALASFGFYGQDSLATLFLMEGARLVRMT